MTQRQVADRLKVSRRAVYEWEADVRLPSQALPALAELYGQSVTALLYGVEPASTELAALREQVDRVVEELLLIRADLDSLAQQLVQFAEQNAATFAELRRLLAPEA